MLALFHRILSWFISLFWKEEMQITLVGLQMSGKTTFVNAIAIWDIGGQCRFRTMWERYSHGVDAIVFMVDAADHDRLEEATNELFGLISKQGLAGIPLLVLGNKNDLSAALNEVELIHKMDLKSIQDRQVACYSISCRERHNLDITLQWLIRCAKSHHG